ncbi:hypothetical protein BDA99DRAFT_517140 [Phascolomyces articulosus]|uniref:Uncharacterized protein n=1 Tax=Phascolomyces articulosus TaxID=60185 RepID=A0AAD5JUV9_9FUNG|nr:hypothetical protein BDA99DRAFT_517140 [Phascolomyces articulosus]
MYIYTSIYWICDTVVHLGLALLGGILTWVNRRGGCTRRSNKPNKADYEDFGMGDNDYPHHRSPTMAAGGVAAGAAVAAASTSPAMTHSNLSRAPTVPRLNDQGTYYDGHPSGYYQQDMMPQQQGYYYPEHQQDMSGQGYYDNSGYYYDQQQPVTAAAGMYGQDPAYMQQGYYKPDLADLHTQDQQPQHTPQMQQQQQPRV